MGRELRKVPADWQHPTDKKGNYIPLFGNSFSKELARWEEHKKKWDEGFVESFKERGVWVKKESKYSGTSYEEWDGDKPNEEYYMPDWTEAERTHIQLYENTTEGTPESPIFAQNEFEKLCEYAAENCTTFADFTATKQEWMEMLKNNFVHAKNGSRIFI